MSADPPAAAAAEPPIEGPAHLIRFRPTFYKAVLRPPGGQRSRTTTVFEPTQVDALVDAIRGLARRGDGIEEALPIVIHAVEGRRDRVLAILERCRTYLDKNVDDVRSLLAVSIMEAISRLAIFGGVDGSDRA